VDEPLHEFHLKKDAGVEDEIQTLRFQRVFVGLLIREHMRFVDGGRKLVVPADAIVAKEAWICQDKNYIENQVSLFFSNDTKIKNIFYGSSENLPIQNFEDLILKLNQSCPGPFII
jgi:hypothetical protein